MYAMRKTSYKTKPLSFNGDDEGMTRFEAFVSGVIVTLVIVFLYFIWSIA